jgi:NAD(P)-dependent dehydrogenase (short-subunit alcohol dehydrogenase family)
VGRVAIVTGGSRGIGAAAARLLAERAWTVCLSYRSDADAAARVLADCPGGAAVQADVAIEADVLALFAAADELGPLGALVNNAGIVGARSRVDELDVGRIERMLAVNVTGPFVCAREAVKRMSTKHGGEGGVIVNVGSVAARIGSGGQYVDYAASKAALDTFTVGLAHEVADEGIRVNCIRPGIIDTDIHASGGEPDRAERLSSAIPMQRPGTAEEIAAWIAFLCSDESSYATGSVIDVSGGR